MSLRLICGGAAVNSNSLTAWWAKFIKKSLYSLGKYDIIIHVVRRTVRCFTEVEVR